LLEAKEMIQSEKGGKSGKTTLWKWVMEEPSFGVDDADSPFQTIESKAIDRDNSPSEEDLDKF
jgi:hypothetical protein